MAEKENKNKTKSKKGHQDRDPNEIIELLKNFYKPDDDELEEFSEFYASIEQKLEEQNPVNRIKKTSSNLEDSLVEREAKLAKFLRRLEEKQKQPPPKRSTKSIFSRPMVVALVILILIALGSIAGFKNFKSYNFISLEGEEIDWSILNLNKEQKAKLHEINQNWKALQAKENSIIKSTKEKLASEINKDKPNFSLIHKYQRDIVDHEVLLKREKLNTFLEKRFILNEPQSLKLIKEIGKNAIK